ncbi:hypothetical protein BC938DRAFT_472073 [Jimgerdemannia flammicorona]|uniref:Uncharacterized protein n=1 Tax=Jimgerdemannia flammicorona TaxID=994334 RepID=A0A433QU71_9FUNG|nr:hypothetical protein BC938DRAFT_472073 [Jimgerdemannia flammicorona]
MAHTQQEELTNAIANVGVDGYETSESDDGDNMDHPMDDEFFDANDVFYDSVGRRISMRYSQAVYSHERHMPKLRVTSADSLARGPLKEEDEEEESEQDYVRSQQLRQAAHEARETDNDRVQVKEEGVFALDRKLHLALWIVFIV